MARLHYCLWPRCSVKLKYYGYCEEHKEKRKKNFTKRDKRGSTERGYDTGWQRFRKWYLKQQDSKCEFCGEPAEELDHIIPLEDGGKKLSTSNVQALCRECHRRKHNATKQSGKIY